MQSLSGEGRFKLQNWAFLILMGAQVAAAILGTELYYVFMPIYIFLYFYLSGDQDIFRKIQNYVSLPLIFIYIILNYRNILDGSIWSLDIFDYRLLFMPVCMLIAIAATYRVSRHCNIVGKNLVISLSVGLIVGTFFYLFFRDASFELSSLIGHARSSGVLRYNENLADDIYIFVSLMAVLGISLVLKGRVENRPLFIGVVVVLYIILAYSLLFLIQGQSRGAWLAILASLLVVGLVRYAGGRRFGVSKLAVGLVVLLTLAKADLILLRTGQDEIPLNGAVSSALSAIVSEANAASVSDASVISAADAQIGLTPISDQASPALTRELLVAQGSFKTRLFIWRDALHLIAAAPATGFLGRDVEEIRKHSLFPEITLSFTHFHNLFLDVGVSFGIPIALYYVLSLGCIVYLIYSGIVSDRMRGDVYINCTLYISLFYFIYLISENCFDVNFTQKEVISVVIAFCAIAGAALGLLDRRGDSNASEAIGVASR